MIRELGADRPLELCEPTESWRVLRGAVELFAVPAADGPEAPRLHMATVEPGAALFGLAAVRLIGVGGPGSAVEAQPAVDPESIERRRWLEELVEAAASPSEDGARADLGAVQLESLLVDAVADRRARQATEDAARARAQGAGHRRAFADGLQALGSLLNTTGRAPQVREGETALAAAFRVVAEAQGTHWASGVRTRIVALTGRWWREDCGPLLAYRGDDRIPVALLPVGAERYQLIDPASGSREVVDEAVAATLATEAVAVYRPLPNGPLGIRRLLASALAGTRRDVVRLLLASLASALLALVVPAATGQLIGVVIPQAGRSELLQLSLALVVAAVAGALFQLTTAIAVLRVQGRVDRFLGPAIWGRLLSLPTGFFRRYSAGDLAFRIASAEGVVQLVSGTAVTALLGGVFSVLSLALIWYYSPSLGLVASALLMALAAVLAIAGRRQLRRQQEAEEDSGALSGMLLEFVTGVGKLKTAGAQERAFHRWAVAFARKRTHGNSARAAENVVTVVMTAFPAVSMLALFAVAGLGADVSPAAFLAVNAAYGQIVVAMLGLSAALLLVLRAVPGLRRLRPILAEAPEDDRTKADPGRLSGQVEFSRVSFRYQPDGPLVLDDVSIRVPAGSSIALVGPSGSGKSTLGRLLLGFETPEEGGIYYDDQDLSGLDLRAVRRQLGVVLQSVELLPGSILSNIVGSAVDLTIDDAWRAAAAAGLADDIRAMPMGMHTAITEGGSTLSGGQRQRLLIARALAGSPRIVLFDEATSALDNTTQAVVAESLRAVTATRIVIAHRLSTVVDADRIYYLERGRIVEAGTYRELMARDGPFASQARRQLS